MDTTAARIEPEILDALQTLQPVPIKDFRLLPNCIPCQDYALAPATPAFNAAIRDHILRAHRDLVII